MKMLRLLQTPWVTVSRASRWIAALLFALALIVGVLVRSSVAWKAIVLSMLLWSLVVGFCWVACMPNSLFLAWDARRLRLPAIGRDVERSLLVYAALSVCLPLAGAVA